MGTENLQPLVHGMMECETDGVRNMPRDESSWGEMINRECTDLGNTAAHEKYHLRRDFK